MKDEASAVPSLSELTQLSFGYTLSPKKMEVRISVNNNEEKVVNSPWDNDRLIIADHIRGDIVGLFNQQRETITKLRKALEYIADYEKAKPLDTWAHGNLCMDIARTALKECFGDEDG